MLCSWVSNLEVQNLGCHELVTIAGMCKPLPHASRHAMHLSVILASVSILLKISRCGIDLSWAAMCTDFSFADLQLVWYFDTMLLVCPW